MAQFESVLVANRGEIAVRIIRAARDHGLRSIAVYADPDRDALHAALADSSYALGGVTAAQTYLSIPAILEVARRSGTSAVHPGYGFLAENDEFAKAVIDAGLIWIGPSPAAIRLLGDKVSARHLAAQVGAPLVPGTPGPVAGAREVLAFAQEHGFPIAIKAAFGGGGRGMRVVRDLDAIPEAYDAAVREAVTAFGRGECFVERYLDRPRHVETQVLADAHGSVVVVSTRDCSLQRRHQKVVEEAPAPFLTQAQQESLYDASKRLIRAADYVGAGTCEFLIGADGTLSFLEVNTRLQVEHPVSEEVTGLDLVREQFRIAAGEPLGYDDPTVVGHSIEFRINGEDPGRDFLPAPGTLSTWIVPAGPGVRVDSGYRGGDVVTGGFDSLLAKLIVTGTDRAQALARSRRALAEFEVDGIATTLPFHRLVVDDPAFAPTDGPFTIHTRWIETEFTGVIAPATGTEPDPPAEMRCVVVEVGGKRLEVRLPADLGGGASVAPAIPTRRARKGSGAATGDDLAAPMQGTVVKVAVEEGDTVTVGDLIVVLEAMKMEQPLTAHQDGIITALMAKPGETVPSGTILCRIVAASP